MMEGIHAQRNAAEARARVRLEVAASVDAAVVGSIASGVGTQAAAAGGKAGVLHEHMMRQSQTAQGAGVRVEQSANALEQAKRETDAVESAVEVLSQEMSRLQEAARTATLNYARSVEQSGLATNDIARCTTSLAALEAKMAEVLLSTQHVRAQADEQRVISERFAAEGEAAALAEAEAVASLAKVEADMADSVHQLRESEVAHSQTQQTQNTLLGQIATIAESSGAKKAAVEKLQRDLQASLSQDEAARVHHAEAQRALAAATSLVTQHDSALVESEVTLQEMISALKAQEADVARKRDLSVKAKLELDRCRQSERKSSDASLEAQRIVHRTEDQLTSANMDFDGVLQLEKEAYASLNASQAAANTTSTSYQEVSLMAENKQKAVTLAQNILLDTRANAARCASGAAKERALATDLEVNLKTLEAALRDIAEETESTRGQLAQAQLLDETVVFDEQTGAQDVVALKQGIAEVALSLSEAETLLATTQAAEREIASEHAARVKDYHLQDTLLQQAADAAKLSRAEHHSATQDLAKLAFIHPNALPHPVPLPLPVAALSPKPVTSPPITSPFRL